MKYLLPIIIICTACGSTWQDKAKTALDAVHVAGKTASVVAEPLYRWKCGDIARRCAKEKDTECKALTGCQNERDKINRAIISLHEAVKIMAQVVPLISSIEYQYNQSKEKK
jgi:hypothetical protein